MDGRFKAAVEAASTPNFINDKAGFIEHFKDEYGTKWTGKAAAFLSGSSDSKSKEYRAAIRQFQGSRLEKEPAKVSGKAAYKEAGEKLPPISRTPNGDVVIHIKGDQKTGKGGTRERNITVTMRGDEAYTWVNDPTWDTMWEYGDYGYNFDEDGEYALTNVSITA